MTDIIDKLHQVLIARKQAEADKSYTASLYQAGHSKVLKKLGEEAIETIIASQDGNPDDIIHETADLWFHSMVLLAYHDINPNRVLAELDRRFGLSGLAEKANRRPS